MMCLGDESFRHTLSVAEVSKFPKHNFESCRILQLRQSLLRPTPEPSEIIFCTEVISVWTGSLFSNAIQRCVGSSLPILVKKLTAFKFSGIAKGGYSIWYSPAPAWRRVLPRNHRLEELSVWPWFSRARDLRQPWCCPRVRDRLPLGPSLC